MLGASNKKGRINKRLLSNILFFLAAVLLVGGIVMLSYDMIKRHLRQEKIDEATTDMEQVIALNAASLEANGEDFEEAVMTLVIDPSALEVYGEDYDYYYSDYSDEVISGRRGEVTSEIDNANTGYITIQGVGILDIPVIDLHVPIWETTNSDTLRYGVGHYVNSVSPGSNGNCTIVGHHMLKYGSIFNRLEEVQIGDIINITDMRGHQYTYFVDELLVVTAEEMLNYVNGGITDTRQVTLITCVYTDQGKKRLLVIGHIQDGT